MTNGVCCSVDIISKLALSHSWSQGPSGFCGIATKSAMWLGYNYPRTMPPHIIPWGHGQNKVWVSLHHIPECGQHGTAEKTARWCCPPSPPSRMATSRPQEAHRCSSKRGVRSACQLTMVATAWPLTASLRAPDLHCLEPILTWTLIPKHNHSDTQVRTKLRFCILKERYFIFLSKDSFN